MSTPGLVGLFVALAAGALTLALIVQSMARHRRRSALLSTALTARERDILGAHVPLVRHLPPELRAKMEGRIHLFLDQVSFIGCNGLEVSEAMRLSIAAQASLLVMNTDQWYDALRTILIYPGAFRSRRQERHGYVVTEAETVRTGESWERGPVVLSWADAEAGARIEHDGHNVVFHEFAHQIDALSGHVDGLPVLGRDQTFAAWRHAFVGAYQRHLYRIEAGHSTVFDAYGAVSQEEFLAVSVEVFMERPAALQQAEPEVYAELSGLLHLDPAAWG